MKYLVELKFTNPSHEHVSLRRRVESVTRLVEATNEDQAILRASQQHRSLGFFIKEAKVVKEKSHDKGADETMVAKGKEVMKKAEGKDEKDEEKAEDIEEDKGTESYPLLKKGEKLKPMKMKEGFDPEPSDIAAHLVKKHGKGKVTKDHVDAYERDRDSNKAIDKEAVMKHVQKISEEVEQIDEGATRWEYSGTVNGKDYTITVPRGADLSNHLGHKKIQRENPHLEPHEVKAVADTSGEDEEHVEVEHEGKKYTHHVTNNQEPRMVYNEEVELDEAQKKLRPSYWKAEWRLGTQSEVDKNNKKIFDKLAKTDPVKASAFHDNLMRMRKKDVKEEVEQIDERNMENKAKKNAMTTKLGVSTYVYGKGVGVSKYDHEPSFKADPAGFKKVGRSVMQSPKTTSSQVTALKKANEEVVTEASKEGKDVMRNMRASLKSMDLRHGVDSDKRVSGYKMSPAVKAAQAKSDALSKVVKRPQAGTLAAAKLKEEFEYIEEKLTAADPASKWISDFVKSDNPKFAGKSKKERIQQALGAYYAAKRGE